MVNFNLSIGAKREGARCIKQRVHFYFSAGEFSKWEEGGEKNGAANKDMEMKTNPDGTTEVHIICIYLSVYLSIYLSIHIYMYIYI